MIQFDDDEKTIELYGYVKRNLNSFYNYDFIEKFKYNITDDFKNEIFIYIYTVAKNVYSYSFPGMCPINYLIENKNTNFINFLREFDSILKEHLLLDNKRSKILGKVYNYTTNKIEYELEDGNFIPEDLQLKTKFKVEFNCNVFPKEYRKIIYKQENREEQLKNILDE
jgi:hypothetical protein